TVLIRANNLPYRVDIINMTNSRLVPLMHLVIRWSSSRKEIERGAPVADALGNVDDRRCSLDGAIGPGRGLQHYQASCRLMCKDPAGPRTLVQRANGGADVRRLPPRASSQPTTSFGLLLWRALCVMK